MIKITKNSNNDDDNDDEDDYNNDNFIQVSRHLASQLLNGWHWWKQQTYFSSQQVQQFYF